MLTSPNRNISQTAQPTFPNSLVFHIWVEEQESNKDTSWKAFSRQIWSSMHSWKLNNLLPKYLLMLPKKKKSKYMKANCCNTVPTPGLTGCLQTTCTSVLYGGWKRQQCFWKNRVLLCCFLVLVFFPPISTQSKSKTKLHFITWHSRSNWGRLWDWKGYAEVRNQSSLFPLAMPEGY